MQEILYLCREIEKESQRKRNRVKWAKSQITRRHHCCCSCSRRLCIIFTCTLPLKEPRCTLMDGKGITVSICSLSIKWNNTSCYGRLPFAKRLKGCLHACSRRSGQCGNFRRKKCFSLQLHCPSIQKNSCCGHEFTYEII